MLIKKQTDDSPSEKDHTEGRAVYLSTLKDAAAALGTYSYEILVALLKHMHYKSYVEPSVSNIFLMFVSFLGKGGQICWNLRNDSAVGCFYHGYSNNDNNICNNQSMRGGLTCQCGFTVLSWSQWLCYLLHRLEQCLSIVLESHDQLQLGASWFHGWEGKQWRCQIIF